MQKEKEKGAKWGLMGLNGYFLLIKNK